jgi:hypothetical protein
MAGQGVLTVRPYPVMNCYPTVLTDSAHVRGCPDTDLTNSIKIEAREKRFKKIVGFWVGVLS